MRDTNGFFIKEVSLLNNQGVSARLSGGQTRNRIIQPKTHIDTGRPEWRAIRPRANPPMGESVLRVRGARQGWAGPWLLSSPRCKLLSPICHRSAPSWAKAVPLMNGPPIVPIGVAFSALTEIEKRIRLGVYS